MSLAQLVNERVESNIYDGDGHISTTLYLVDLCADGDILPWKSLAVFGVEPQLLEPHERKAIEFAYSSLGAQACTESASGIDPHDMLWRIADLYKITRDVAGIIGEDNSAIAIASAIGELLDR
jgi:hypothetical protein